MTKTFIRAFTISDYEEEELWLRSMHNNGFRFVHFTIPFFYTFETCEPEDVIYRFEYKNEPITADYLQMYSDFGWEYIESAAGWNYFRRKASETDSPESEQIFSSAQDKIAMIDKIYKTRMLPLFIIFCCCIVPNLYRLSSARGAVDITILVVFAILFVLYLYIFYHCGTGLKRLKSKYEEENRGR